MDDYILVITDENNQGGRSSSSLPNPFEGARPDKNRRGGIPVPVEKIEAGMTDFLRTIGKVIKRSQKSAADLGGMELNEIELAVEVNGEGQFSLLGSGAKIGGKSAITLRFKKTEM